MIPKRNHKEIARLLEVLQVTGQRLEELTHGQVDTAADPEGRILLLRGTQQQIEHNEVSRQAAILNALPVHIALLDRDGTIISVNDGWRMFASSNSYCPGPGQGLGENYLAVCDHAEGPGAENAHFAADGIRAVLNGTELSFAFDYECSSSVEKRWFHLSVAPLSTERPKGAVVMHADISASKRDQAALALLAERLSLATEVAKVGVWEWDVATDEIVWDATMFGIYSLPQAATIKYEQWSAAVHPEDLQDVEVMLRRAIARKSEEIAEFRITAGDGSLRYISTAAKAVAGASGKIDRVIGVNFDVTERKRSEAESRRNQAIVTHMAEHDFLTGLPNQMVLRDRIDQAIKTAARSHRKIAILFLDLDGFKHINDSLGHLVGDKLLQSTARRLQETMRASDTLSRFGGDEFVLLLEEVQHPEGTPIAAARLLEAIASTHSVGEHELQVSACIGISVYPEDGTDADALIKNADTAMYYAKSKGRSNFQFFHSDMNLQAVERQFLEQNLRRALARNELMLHYQPKFDLKLRTITGVEALLRWNHPVRGWIAPAQFIPVAEDCGLILPIGMWVLKEACTQARLWVEAGLPAVTMAVNVSARQFQSEGFEEAVLAILSRTSMEPRHLELEVTESLLMKGPEHTASLLQNFRRKGIKVAIDDFGTGYSSLSYLQRFPIDTLKVDQSFVRQLDTPDGLNIVKAIILMGRNMGMRIVAEGVETEHQADLLRGLDCNDAQGYFFSRPLPPSQVACLLEERSRMNDPCGQVGIPSFICP